MGILPADRLIFRQLAAVAYESIMFWEESRVWHQSRKSQSILICLLKSNQPIFNFRWSTQKAVLVGCRISIEWLSCISVNIKDSISNSWVIFWVCCDILPLCGFWSKIPWHMTTQNGEGRAMNPRTVNGRILKPTSCITIGWVCWSHSDIITHYDYETTELEWKQNFLDPKRLCARKTIIFERS